MTTFFITGASRGLGLGLAAHYAGLPDSRVYAAARKPAAVDLAALVAASEGRLVPISLDVDDPASIAAAAAKIRDTGATIDVLINSAGIASVAELGEIELEDFLSVIKTNAAGPLLVTQALRNVLSTHARIVNITSRLGSIEDADGSWGYAYPASKAALNMVSRQLAATLGSHDITVLALHPGWVQTDMGSSSGGKPSLTVEQSVLGMSRVIDALTSTQNGTFLQWDGSSLPW